jgi:hypothetical protein
MTFVAQTLLEPPAFLTSDLKPARVTYARCLEAAVHLLRGAAVVDVEMLLSHALSAWHGVPILPGRLQ